jgi:hypothetical protein
MKVWSLLSLKTIISSKLVELEKYTAQIPTAPPIYTNTQLKFFTKAKFIESLDFFWKVCFVTFQKNIICPNK